MLLLLLLLLLWRPGSVVAAVLVLTLAASAMILSGTSQQRMCIHPGVVFVEQRCAVPASSFDKDVLSTWVILQVGRDVVHFAMKHHPGVVCCLVLLHFIDGDGLPVAQTT